MLLPEQVKTLIEGVTPCEHVEVEGDGHHFFAVIVSSSFEGKARLARHRLIKDGLKPQLESNELHALSISVAATPAEWAAKQTAFFIHVKQRRQSIQTPNRIPQYAIAV